MKSIVFQPSLISKILALLICINHTQLLAQHKNDFIWLLGSSNGSPDTIFGGNLIDFAQGDPTIEYIDIQLDMWFPAIISDESGQLSFYTNGCKMLNGTNELIENGTEINPGYVYEAYCNDPNHPVGYPSYQGNLLLPYPGHNGQYFYFHSWVDEILITRKLLYSFINMNENGGLGKIEVKNQVLLEDTLTPAVTATRHANGRDWWIVAARESSSVYYVFLLDPEGLHPPTVQVLDSTWIPGHIVNLSNVFSPDGTKFVRFGGGVPADFIMYNFDRCSGQLYNPVTIHLPDTVSASPWGCFSPNSRFLYVQNEGDKLHQFDTWATDISSSVQLVGIYDGFKGPFGLSTRFNSMTVGPDQRIYMSCRSGVNFLHVIHQPNEPGLNCDFRQHDIELPAIYPFFLPNMPFYRLHKIPGSECDSLNIQEPLVAFWRYKQDSLASATKIDFTDISYFDPIQWNWTFGDGFTSTEQFPSHIYAEPGVYNVCLNVCNSAGICDDLCKNVVVKNVSVGSKQLSETFFKFYPNPTSDYLVFELPNSTSESIIYIYDMNGREIIRKNIAPSVEIYRFELNSIPPGVYCIKISNDNKVHGAHFIKS